MGREEGEERGGREVKRVERHIVPQNWPTLKISPCTE